MALLQLRSDRQAGVGSFTPLPPLESAVYELPFSGINVALEQYGSRAQRQERLSELGDAGFGWVRLRVDWSQIEPQPDSFTWSETDEIIQDMRSANFEPVVVLVGSPAWARPGTEQGGSGNEETDELRRTPQGPPADFHDFAQFVSAFADRYADDVRFYEVWDEPNIFPHWGQRWVNPVEYSQMLRLAATAIREADPDAVILTAALAPTADRGHLAIDEVYFLQRMIAAGAAPYFDAVALQPLGFGDTPDNPEQRIGTLDFHRAGLVRRALVAAGLGHKSIVNVRFGWNRSPHSPWGAVSTANQRDFAVRALDLAYNDWPWLAAMAWAIDAPSADRNDPIEGFAPQDDLVASIAQWHAESGGRTARSVSVPQRGWTQWIVLALVAALTLWRGYAATRVLPLERWREAYLRLPRLVHAVVWATLLAIYFFAVWPPLVVLCWAVAAILIWLQPIHGLLLAAAVLPFWFQHKELEWGEVSFTVAPITAASLCMVPRLLWSSVPMRRALDQWDALAAAWIGVIVVSATAVWHWPAYARGVVEFALTPLVLFWAVRAWTNSGRDRRSVLRALVFGGVVVALMGLGQWLRGGGTEADTVRRLVGPYYSANHAALYLERTLFVALGLALFHARSRRWLYAAMAAVLAIALLLTASRGGLLLAVPAGLLVLGFYALFRSRPHRAGARLGRRIILLASFGILLVSAISAIALPWGRLANSDTVSQRWMVWQYAARVSFDHWLTGVGPNGFFWTFAEYIPVGAPIDPNLLHPHNVWLEFATMAGIFGIAWLVAAAITIFRSIFAEQVRERAVPAWPGVGLLAALTAAVAHGQVDAFGALPDLAAWNWMALGLLAAGLSPPNPLVRSNPEDTTSHQ